MLARIYAIPLDAAAAAGFAVPTDSATTELAFLRRMEAVADADTEGHPADPVEVFLRRWLRDHVPQDRLPAARFITYDSFQFMFDEGRITGLLDFEHAHVGDPMMDLAALRIRDTLKNLGDLAELADALRGGHRRRHRSRRRRVPDRALQRVVGRVGRRRRSPIRCRAPTGSRTSRGTSTARAGRSSRSPRSAATRSTGGDPRRATDAPRARAPVPGRRPARRRRPPTATDYELVRARAHRQPPEAGRRDRRPVRRRRPRRADRPARPPARSRTMPTPSWSTYIERAGSERRGSAGPAARRARAAAAPHHGVAHLADAPPSRRCAASGPSGRRHAAHDESWPTGAIPGTR